MFLKSLPCIVFSKASLVSLQLSARSVNKVFKKTSFLFGNNREPVGRYIHTNSSTAFFRFWKRCGKPHFGQACLFMWTLEWCFVAGLAGMYAYLQRLLLCYLAGTSFLSLPPWLPLPTPPFSAKPFASPNSLGLPHLQQIKTARLKKGSMSVHKRDEKTTE